jgi:hypothetical protein
MGGACNNTRDERERERDTGFWWEILKEGDGWEGLGIEWGSVEWIRLAEALFSTWILKVARLQTTVMLSHVCCCVNMCSEAHGELICEL